MKRFIHLILAILLILGALGHVFLPEMYAPMIPEAVPQSFAHTVSILFEAGLGILLLLPKYRHWGGLGFMFLMIGFLPIHIWDLFKATPAIGPHPIPIIRVFVQFLLIYAGFWVFKRNKKNQG